MITNLETANCCGDPKLDSGIFKIYADSTIDLLQQGGINWFYQGYVLLRNGTIPDKGRENLTESIGKLIASGNDYYQHIKGNNVVVVLGKSCFEVYGDRFGVQKWFYWSTADKYIVSDSLDLIRRLIHPEISPESIALYALTYHFSSGSTLFKDIKHNVPAQFIRFKDNCLRIGTYWDGLSLLNLPRQQVDIKHITDLLGSHIEELLSISPKAAISLSLTGGADTRNLLALMLSRDIKPHLYTYGNPNSVDCVKARKIANKLGLKHRIHDIAIHSELFQQYAESIIHWGQSLSSIHRVHRIIAVEREAEYANTMFLGTMGGEFVRGVSQDDYIVPSLIYQHWERDRLTNSILADWLNSKYIRIESIDLDLLLETLNRETYIDRNPVEKKLATLINITAHLHDAQDIMLYQRPMKHVFTPFLDIDYLELLFSSQYSFNNKEQIRGKIRRKVQNPVYSSRFIKTAFPALGQFEYSGHHVPNEVLFNPYIAAVMKGARKKLSKPYPPNFPLGPWMDDFIMSGLADCAQDSMVNEVFDIKAMRNDLQAHSYVPRESFWLKYSNPIMMKYSNDRIG